MGRYYRCGCCGRGYRSDKPQDPEHDTGFGTCDDCHEGVATDWVRYGFNCRPMTVEDARARLARYA